MDKVEVKVKRSQVSNSPMSEAEIKQLMLVMPAKHFVVVGSHCFNKYGLMDPGSIKDIDIILVGPTEEAESFLKRAEEADPIDLPKYPGQPQMYAFYWNGRRVNVFINSGEHFLEIDEIKWGMILNTVKAKKSYGRPKDWAHLYRLARLFYKEEEYQKYVDGL
jgi:hypothetical protein